MQQDFLLKRSNNTFRFKFSSSSIASAKVRFFKKQKPTMFIHAEDLLVTDGSVCKGHLQNYGFAIVVKKFWIPHKRQKTLTYLPEFIRILLPHKEHFEVKIYFYEENFEFQRFPKFYGFLNFISQAIQMYFGEKLL